MEKAHRNLVKWAIREKGLMVSVFDGEEWAVSKSRKEKEIFEAIDSVEESEIRLLDDSGNKVGWALIIDYYDEPECTVADHTENALMDEWARQYEKKFKLV